MSSNDVIKSVAKRLKYYFEIQRLEDGFDLSDVHQPLLDHPPLKVRPALQTGVLRDKPIKHHFSRPEVRAQLTHLNGKNAREPIKSKKEAQVRKLLENYMKSYCFQEDCFCFSHSKMLPARKKTLPNCYCFHQAKKCPHGLKLSSGLRRRKKQRNIVGGWPLLRSVPDQHISRGEATRLVNSATKILAATTNLGLYPGAVDYTLVKYDPSLYTKNQPKKQITAKYSPVYTRKERALSRQQKKFVDDSDTESNSSRSSGSRPHSPTPSHSSSRSSSSSSSSGYTKSSVVSNRSSSTTDKPSPTSARFRSQAFITLPETEQKEEIKVVQSTQTVDLISEPAEQQKKSQEEVCVGPLCQYEVYVRTGNRLGASTKASIKMIMYGEKGRTKEFVLKDSKKHKIPFQKGREDMFALTAHHIGQIKQIQIGHDRSELNYAWYLEGVTVFDIYAKQIFQFPCERWLSGQDGDKKTYRILDVDKERDFMEALDRIKSKSSQAPGYKDSSDSDSSEILVNGQSYKNKVKSKDTSSSDYISDRDKKSIVHETPRTKQRHVLKSRTIDDDEHREDRSRSGPVFRLLSAHDNKQVDEIYMEAQGKSKTSELVKETNKPRQNEQKGSKDASSENETEKKHQLERGRAMELTMLQGKGIHDAVRAGDLERVKDLINSFNEMKDFRDGNGWTPIHLAAARGNIDILRWLVTSDADINAVTPTGYNAMHIAAMHGHMNSMMVLQAMGCSITSVTLDKQSALHLASKNGHLECIKWLVANRASITQKDNKGKTAGQLAEDNHFDQCADFLNVCLQEVRNPKSTFYQINEIENSLTPITEDCSSVLHETPRKVKTQNLYSS
ncbi:uncharacterized protein LOC106068824 isoform X3 [Biomphalaria glabrata]|uniref:Uncharacterized protein LOC106068824 isoform X3 n=1 Tax=Biomphalaria glabrata TaxID=6526 RepID=A0A9U8EE44_BIOGL|nr:uncharacterized protein LOC106068824 isoform X3 [Biomphalaria glabrata]